tara:strand:+ start:1904 stop:4585 length:2682 start_codon:yes stop_codon:yes gene_type:complete
MADEYPSCELLSSLSTLALFVRDYEDSFAKSAVYNTIIGLTTEIPRFRERLHLLEFLCPPLVMMRMGTGMIAYTLEDLQINVHFAIPEVATMTVPMMHEMGERFDEARFARYAINMKPLRVTAPDVDGTCVRYRRTIPRLANAFELIGDEYMQFEGVVVHAHEVFVDPRRVLLYVPLTTSSGDDPDDMVYWARTSCGSLVAFRNPKVPLVAAATAIPCTNQSGILCISLPQPQHAFFRALYPNSIEHTIEALRDRHIPYRVKTILVQICITCFGMRDELILEVGSMVEYRRIASNPFHMEMMHMTQIIKMSYLNKNGSNHVLAKSLAKVLADCDDQLTWRRWARYSPFVHYVLDLCEVSTLESMYQSYPFTRVALVEFLVVRVGNWAQPERQKAVFLASFLTGDEDGDVRVVLDELARLNDRAQRTLMGIVEKEDAPRVATCAVRRNRPSRPTRKVSPPPPPPGSPPVPTAPPPSEDSTMASRSSDGPAAGTHHHIVEKLSARWPDIEWTLIGSGIFSSVSDVDLVATVLSKAPADDPLRRLQKAYDQVRETTEFVQRGPVDGNRICTLYGSWEDGGRAYPLDVQVTTGGDTASERSTALAMSLASRLHRECDVAMRENFKHLHRWFLATDLKGHSRCHLPGVAVTSLTVVTTRCMGSLKSSIPRILESLRDRVHQARPRIDIDSWGDSDAPPRERRRPLYPIEVVIDEKNVATRVTAGWTRHLCDTILFSMTLTPERLFLKDVYAAWRRHGMTYCATFRPKSSGSLNLSLLPSLHRFDVHPLVDSYHAGDDGVAPSDVVLRCTLREGFYPNHSFRGGDTFEAHDGYVTVTRGTRRTRLNTSPGVGIPFDSACATDTHCRCMFDSGRRGRFPNAPFLSTDAVLAFGPMHWTVV